MRKGIFRLILSAVLVCAAMGRSSAQLDIIDNLGQPLLTKAYTDVKGSPYLYDTWMKGTVTTGNGKTYDGVELMYDQVADVLIFKSEKGETRTFTQPVKQFSLKLIKGNVVMKEQVFRREFAPVDGASALTFYEVLADGKTQLLKRTSKRIVEETPYNSASKVKSFHSDSHYYIAKDGNLIRIKNNKKAVVSALQDKQKELEVYIKENKLNLSKDNDLAQLVKYYNTLS